MNTEKILVKFDHKSPKQLPGTPPTAITKTHDIRMSWVFHLGPSDSCLFTR